MATKCYIHSSSGVGHWAYTTYAPSVVSYTDGILTLTLGTYYNTNEGRTAGSYISEFELYIVSE